MAKRLKTSRQITRTQTPALSAARPVQFIDPTGASIGNNKQFLAGQSRTGRAASPWIDYDTHENVTRFGRRKLMVKGRWLASNFPALTGAILEQAELSCGTWIPEFRGADKEWGKVAADWLIEWEKIMDIRGCLDGSDLRDQLVSSCMIDGELGILETETTNKHPRIQVFRSHRVGSNTERQFETKRYRVVDGVQVNRFGAPVAYVINQTSQGNPILVPARSFILAFEKLPGMPDQIRGFSWLGSSAEDWEDLDESRRFELAAQKACSRPSLIEHNESGTIDPAKHRLATSATFDETDKEKDTAPSVYVEDQYHVFKAGTGGRLESFKYDRPGQNVQAYQAMVETHGFRGIGWSRHYSLDPSKLGGATMRVEVERITRTIRRRQKLVYRVMRRIHSFAIGRAISLGELPPNPEFWKWDYQTPEMPTADRKYESDISVQENNAGFTTQDEITGRRGKRWQDVQDQRIVEAKSMVDKVKETFGVEIDPLTLLFPNAPTIESRPEREPVNQDDDEKDLNNDE